ncbi:MAG: nickel pincer cofactor biosynthesis protein LarC [Aureliella sp.]
MKIAYLDTASGIAGDMTLCALIDAGADADYIQKQIASLNLGDVKLEFTETYRHCFRALRLDVRHPPEHAHRHLSDIEKLIAQSSLTESERSTALRLFRKVGQAEAKVHGTSIEEVHFHEVGAVDSIVDIVGVAVAVDNLGIEKLYASATPTGCGTITIAHGPVSVPAPATAELLRGVPVLTSDIEFELTTPTGAAILSTLADGFGPLPTMTIHSVGYGAGHKDLKQRANVLRVIVGESSITGAGETDEVVLLETNLDDATGEKIGFAIEQLWAQQPLDVFTSAIGMKKNRPGIKLSVLVKPEDAATIEAQMLALTGSLGIRRSNMSRRLAVRSSLDVETEYGSARAKVAWHESRDGQLAPAVAPEFEDCKRIALENGCSLDDAYHAVESAARIAVAQLQPPPSTHLPSTNMPAASSQPQTWPRYEGNDQANDHGHDHHHDHSHDHDTPHDHHHH